jgi:hypothetical protein
LKKSQLEYLIFDDPGAMEQVAVRPLGLNLYRLAEAPLMLSEELELGTVVEAERDSDGVLRITRVVESSSLEVSEYLLDHRVRDSRLFKVFCEKLEEAGGEWELIKGAWLRIHLPPDSSFDAKAELDAISPASDEDG